MAITPLPTPPTRSDPTNFAARGDAFMTALPTFVTEANSLASTVNSQATQVGIDAANAVANATICQAAANFKGNWSSLVGALNMPAAVYHNYAFWILTANLTDVTVKTPGVAPEWVQAKTMDSLPTFQASGTVTAGDPVVLTSTGKVGKPVIQNESSGTAATIASYSSNASACYDPQNDKVIAAYYNNAPGSTRAAVGTVNSDGTITWAGECLTYIDLGQSPLITYAGSGKVVIFGWLSTSRLACIVGTVSGTSITFGSAVYITAAASNYSLYDAKYDAASGKVLVAAYTNDAAPYNKFFVGTVSGTSITFGSAVATPSSNSMSLYPIGDGNILFYGDNSGGTAQVACLGVVSGSSISFGTLATIPSSVAGAYLPTYFPAAKKAVFIGKSGNFIIYSATISGTSLLFDSVALTTSSTGIYISGCFDASTQRYTLFFADTANSNYGTVLPIYFYAGQLAAGNKTVILSASPSTTFSVYHPVKSKSVLGYITTYATAKTWTNYATTAANYIGIAQDTVADAGYLKVAPQGRVDTHQAGLTISAKYYLTDAGALTTTDTGIYAGIATAATDLLVKG